MTGPDLRRAMHDLGEDAHVPDLLDRALATSRRIRRRRLAAAATGTALTLVIAASAVAMVRPPNETIAPPGSTMPSTGTPTLIPSPSSPPFNTGATLPIPPPVSDQSPPTVPPAAGGTVYYLHFDGSRNSVYSVTGAGTPKLVVADVSSDIAVSPDATKLAWIESPASGTSTSTVMVSNLDGSDKRAVAEAQYSGGLCVMPAWAPDSRRILFRPSGGYHVPWVTVDVTNGHRTALELTDGCYPTWSPDGGTIGWYDHAIPGSGVILTDALGRGARTMPPVDGVRACQISIYAVGPEGRRALVDKPIVGKGGCPDWPGRDAWRGVVVDTSTGRSLDLPVKGGLTSAVFLADGGLVGRTAATGEMILLDAGLKLVARWPAAPGDNLILLAYVP